jgi:hypothetical protein
MRARLVATLIVVVAGLAAAGPAGADGRGGGAFIDETGSPTATASDGGGGEGGTGTSGGESGGSSPCTWHVMVEDDFEFAVYGSESGTPQHSATGRWLERRCPGLGAVEVNGQFLVPEGGLVDPRQLALDALASARIPSPPIRTSPADGALIVQVPTWLWLDGGWWRGYDATAGAGRVRSTVTARPVSVTWTTGDGATVKCQGPGTAWRRGTTAEPTCSHVYRTSSTSSPSGRFDLQATVALEVSWVSNVGDGGALTAITRTSTVSVEVGEIQAIGTNGGSR